MKIQGGLGNGKGHMKRFSLTGFPGMRYASAHVRTSRHKATLEEQSTGSGKAEMCLFKTCF
jgi:hypothetical protein